MIKTTSAGKIREEIANNFKIFPEQVRCSRCAKWAYNNGGVLTSVCSSRCKMRKHKTESYQFCKGFAPRKEV